MFRGSGGSIGDRAGSYADERREGGAEFVIADGEGAAFVHGEEEKERESGGPGAVSWGLASRFPGDSPDFSVER